MRRDIWKSMAEYFTKRVSWVDWDFRAVCILIVSCMFFASIYIEAATGNTDCKSHRQGKLRSHVTESWRQHLTRTLNLTLMLRFNLRECVWLSFMYSQRYDVSFRMMSFTVYLRVDADLNIPRNSWLRLLKDQLRRQSQESKVLGIWQVRFSWLWVEWLSVLPCRLSRTNRTSESHLQPTWHCPNGVGQKLKL